MQRQSFPCWVPQQRAKEDWKRMNLLFALICHAARLEAGSNLEAGKEKGLYDGSFLSLPPNVVLSICLSICYPRSFKATLAILLTFRLADSIIAITTIPLTTTSSSSTIRPPSRPPHPFLSQSPYHHPNPPPTAQKCNSPLPSPSSPSAPPSSPPSRNPPPSSPQQ